MLSIMDGRQERRVCRTALVLVILSVVSLPGPSHGVKVIEIDGSPSGMENAAINEVLQLEAPQRITEDEAPRPVYHRDEEAVAVVENAEDHPHAVLENKPTKFDLDVTGMIHTDRKNLHEAEAERLANLSKMTGTTVTTNRMDEEDECADGISMACLKEGLGELLDDMASVGTINITESVQIVKTSNATGPRWERHGESDRSDIIDRVQRFAKNHVLRVTVPKELLTSRQSRTFFGSKFCFDLM